MLTAAIAQPPSTYITCSSFFTIQYTWKFHLNFLLCIVYICVYISIWLNNLYFWQVLIFLFSKIYFGFTPLRHHTSWHYTSWQHDGKKKWIKKNYNKNFNKQIIMDFWMTKFGPYFQKSQSWWFFVGLMFFFP